MITHLIDTCTISDLFKKNPSVVNHFQRLSPDCIGISTITYMEIEYGLAINPEREVKIRPLWAHLLEFINVIPYTAECAKRSALLRHYLKNKGMLIGPYDILIAGTCLAQKNNPTLVTSNMKEFNRVPDLLIEDWKHGKV